MLNFGDKIGRHVEDAYLFEIKLDTKMMNNEQNHKIGIQALPILLCCLSSIAYAEKSLQVGICELTHLLSYQQHNVSVEVMAREQIQVSSELAGRVQQLHVEYTGQAVKAGELLVQLDDTDLQLQAKKLTANLKSIKAQLDFARYQLKQARKLHAQKSTSEQILRQRQSELTRLQAERQSLQVQQQQVQHNLSKTRITAPFAGVILQRHISLGAWVQSGQALLTLHNPTKVEIHAFLDKGQLQSLQTGTQIQLQDGKQSYPLNVYSVLPQLETQRHLYQAILLSEAATPPAGLQGFLHWQSQSQSLSANYVVSRNQQLGLMWLDDNKVQFKSLPDALPGRRVLITDLAPEMQIVVSGHQQLEEGQTVASKRACSEPS